VTAEKVREKWQERGRDEVDEEGRAREREGEGERGREKGRRIEEERAKVKENTEGCKDRRGTGRERGSRTLSTPKIWICLNNRCTVNKSCANNNRHTVNFLLFSPVLSCPLSPYL
jgi:hypothetical protein